MTTIPSRSFEFNPQNISVVVISVLLLVTLSGSIIPSLGFSPSIPLFILGAFIASIIAVFLATGGFSFQSRGQIFLLLVAVGVVIFLVFFVPSYLGSFSSTALELRSMVMG